MLRNLLKKLVFRFEQCLARTGFIIGIPLIIITVLDVINVVGRKFGHPLGFTVESVESLMVLVTYFGVVFVAKEGGHVNVPLFTRKLSSSKQCLLDFLSSIIGAIIFAIWGWGAWIVALRSIKVMEVRMGVYMFPVWPFKTLFALGITFFVIQLLLCSFRHLLLALGDSDFKKQGEEEAKRTASVI